MLAIQTLKNALHTEKVFLIFIVQSLFPLIYNRHRSPVIVFYFDVLSCFASCLCVSGLIVCTCPDEFHLCLVISAPEKRCVPENWELKNVQLVKVQLNATRGQMHVPDFTERQQSDRQQKAT